MASPQDSVDIAAGESSLLVYVDGGRVGDMLNMLPAIRRLKPCFPGYRVCWLTGQERHSALETGLAPLSVGLVDEFIQGANVGAAWSQWFSPPLRGRRFDIIIDCQTRVRCTLILKRIHHGIFVSGAAGFRFSDRRPFDGERPGPILERFVQLVELASARPCVPDFETRIPAGYRQAALSLLPGGSDYVGLAPGAGDRRKRWPLSAFLEIASLQAKRGRTPVFFMGPDEQDEIAGIREAIPQALFPEYVEMPGIERSPVLAIALAERLSVGIANDAGVGHMLGAGRQPLITLFGHTSSEKFRIRPSTCWVPLSGSDFGDAGIAAIPVEAVDGQIEQIFQQRCRPAS
jgi:ADP-heptose:LPS heptosyltransferase